MEEDSDEVGYSTEWETSSNGEDDEDGEVGHTGSWYSGTSPFQSPGNEGTSVYSGTPLFQPPEMRTPLYTVEPLYSNPLK